MTRNHTDTMELRREFAEKFLAAPQDHDTAVLDGPMELLLTEFDAELCAAKRRWTHLDLGAERAEMDQWLSERGYTDPANLED